MEKLSHAYMVVSASEREREETALRLAQMMLCEDETNCPCGHCRHCRKVRSGIHPDLSYVERDKDENGNFKREFSVKKMRWMLSDAWVRPNEAERKVYILRDAQTLNQSAQNAILKLLEEPPGRACFILCTDNAHALLETVRSRCTEWRVAAEAEQQFEEMTRASAEEYLALAAKADLPELIKLLSGWEKLSTADFRELIACLAQRVSDAACLRGEIPGIERGQLLALVALMERAEEYLRANVATKHIVGLLMADTLAEQGR